MSDELSADLASLKIDRGKGSRDPERRSPLRLAVVACAVLAAAGAVAYVAVPYIRSKVITPEVSVTEIVLVSPAQASVELTATGYVKPQLVSEVAPKVAGKVRAVSIKQGDRVEAGAPLYELDAADQEAAIAKARADVAAARARAATAEANLAEIRLQARRARELAQKGVRPEATAEDLEARVASLERQLAASRAEVTAAAAQVNALSINLGSYTVVAPIAGTVINEPPDVGEAVSPAAGGGVVELADFASLAVETDVPEGRLHLVARDSPAEIVLDAFPSRRYRGKTTQIVPRVDRAKATVTVKVSFVDALDGVLPDMSARVSFLARELDAAAVAEPPAPVVPDAALVERGGGHVVFVVEDGRVRMTPVKVGEAKAGGRVLIDGPAPGTKVVKNPVADLQDGQKVKERTDG